MRVDYVGVQWQADYRYRRIRQRTDHHKESGLVESFLPREPEDHQTGDMHRISIHITAEGSKK